MCHDDELLKDKSRDIATKANRVVCVPTSVSKAKK